MNHLKLPAVSIIMPIRNEGAYIERSLMSAFMQDYPPDLLEVVVVDGNSIDETRAKIAGLSQRFPDRQIKVIENPNQYMPMGFNLGLKQVHSEIVIMMGGHAELALDYVSQCVNLLNECPVECVGGAMETVANGWVSQAIAIAMASSFGVGNVAFRTRPDRIMEVDTAVFAAYRSHIFNEIGCLDEEMIRNQDDEFNYRLREHGGRILYSPKIHSTYYSRSSLLSLWSQYFQYGYYKVRVLQKHPHQMSFRQFIPLVFVVVLLVSILLVFSTSFFYFPSFFFPLSFFTPLLYLLANISASLYTASKQGWKYLPLIPLVFAILHLSYGLGFLAGLFKFWNRWGDKTGKVPMWSTNTNG